MNNNIQARVLRDWLYLDTTDACNIVIEQKWIP